MPVLLSDREGATAILTMNRPEALNALSLELEAALKDAFRAVSAEDGLRAVVAHRLHVADGLARVDGLVGHGLDGLGRRAPVAERAPAEHAQRVEPVQREQRAGEKVGPQVAARVV